MSRFDNWATRSEPAFDDVASVLEDASGDHGNGPVEYFHRSSTTRRVEKERSAAARGGRIGREQGGALRWIDPRRAELGFVAASGGARAALAACRSMASETPGKPVTACPWNVEAESVDDLDPARLPAVEELEAWLDEKTPETAKDAWVEASSSSETWATAEGRVQRRARGRVWAVFTPSEGLGMGGKPLFLAARSWREMSRLEPARAWLERSLESAGEHPWPDDAKLVFSPETSAFLAHLLATVAHRPGIEPGNPVGPGWVLTARPGDEPACLFGSVVDDAGFTGESRILADGNHVVDDWGGPGSLKRASFRDVPEPSAVSLRLKPPRIDAPHRSVWITRIDLHPADAGWLAELHGRRYPDGAALCPKWCRLRPQELLETCLGGLGEPFASHLGTTTPALVFDAFLFRAD